jgi:hypothetical protein
VRENIDEKWFHAFPNISVIVNKHCSYKHGCYSTSMYSQPTRVADNPHMKCQKDACMQAIDKMF